MSAISHSRSCLFAMPAPSTSEVHSLYCDIIDQRWDNFTGKEVKRGEW
jgi:hypothetical protein